MEVYELARWSALGCVCGWSEVNDLKDIQKIKWIIFVNRLDVKLIEELIN